MIEIHYNSIFVNNQFYGQVKNCLSVVSHESTSSPYRQTCHYFTTYAGKVYKMLGLIRRRFSVSCPISARRKLYISLVRSQLLYYSQIWRPSLIKHINILERIQRRATKFILNDFHSTYKSRLVTLKMLPLMYIYEINDILFFIKSYKSPTSHFNINSYLQFSSSNTRFGSSAKLVHHRCSTNLTHHFYFHRIPRLWNSLHC